MQGTAPQIVKFISYFSQEIRIQVLRYFHRKVTCSLSSNYCEKIRMLNFLTKLLTNFLLVLSTENNCSSKLKIKKRILDVNEIITTFRMKYIFFQHYQKS